MTEATPVSLGAVYTQPWVAATILDLVGYREDADLVAHSVVEPCCGEGAFVAHIVRRLVRSAAAFSRPIADAAGSLRAFDVDPVAVAACRARVETVLVEEGISATVAHHLARTWVQEADFLIAAVTTPPVDWVVGNPPYLRVEDVPAARRREYRTAWPTMTGRADVYVGFFEAALSMLKPGGSLGFIAPDRWMKNQYGAVLRQEILERYALEIVVELHSSDVFESRVSAYPAISVISRRPYSESVFVRTHSGFAEGDATDLVECWWTDDWSSDHARFDAQRRHIRGSEGAKWAIAAEQDLKIIAHLEDNFPLLADAGVDVRGGIATGADRVYITEDLGLVEPEVLVPLVGPKDIVDGRLVWSGRYLINPWGPDGLVALSEYPLLGQHLLSHETTLRSRHTARRTPLMWWRTIDRPNPEQWRQPKLILADIKNRLEPVLDVDGRLPMHSLYYMTSTNWDLEVLGGLLLSDTIGRLVAAYSVVMASGSMRVSAQYLRLIRVPVYESIPADEAEQLRVAFVTRDRALASKIAERLLRIT